MKSLIFFASLILTASGSTALADDTLHAFDCVFGYRLNRKLHFSLVRGFIDDISPHAADTKALSRSRGAHAGRAPLLIACQLSGSKEAGYINIKGRFYYGVQAGGESTGLYLKPESGEEIEFDRAFLDKPVVEGEILHLRGFFQTRAGADNRVRRVYIPIDVLDSKALD